ncbi:hypothetical protein OHA18_12855 [Kribbella sp. NBC_00709]|uniref:hypothetical protein n=1 Tax=Kribbella sp. NBC_00709 TaxID=2975972 RepID=UPI002E2B9185|nr:hypothetical protein [Kribbella sp. NBC_00709]
MATESEHTRRAPLGINVRARAQFDRDGEVASVSKLTLDESGQAHRWVITRDGHAVHYRDDDPGGMALNDALRSRYGQDLTGTFAAGLPHISPDGARRLCDEAKTTARDEAGRAAIDRWYRKITPALEARWSIALLGAAALKNLQSDQKEPGRSTDDSRAARSRPQTPRIPGRTDHRGPGGRGRP